ncbi:MAG: hypothetical protein ACRD3E_09755 [Terriglobales bacterium]
MKITRKGITAARLQLLESFKELADCRDLKIVRKGLRTLRHLDDLVLDLNDQRIKP